MRNRTRRGRRAAALGICAALVAARAFAAEIYVSSATGANDNPGTKEKPKKLLWKAMADLKSGDRVRVAEGTYAGQSKSGLMPKITVSDIVIEGGWTRDFSARDPFAHPSVIAAPPDAQGETGSVFAAEKPDGSVRDVTIDGFCIDRGPANYYYGDGEPGANKAVEGHQRDGCWGYQNLNKKMSGSDPAVRLAGKGSFTVRNMVLVNCPWWGISVKGGGSGPITIENNLVLGCQGRGIEAVAGGGWGAPEFVIRNNTVLFSHAVSTTEGNALSLDPRDGRGKYTVERNVLAFSDGSGVSCGFEPGAGMLMMRDNLFFFNRRGDFGIGGTGVANASGFEDDLKFSAPGNAHALPACLGKVSSGWFDRWSTREDVDLLAGTFNKSEELAAARAALGLAAYRIPGYDATFAAYKDLPKSRNKYTMSRYPRPMKKGEAMDWNSSVLPLVGADGARGVRAAGGSPAPAAR